MTVSLSQPQALNESGRLAIAKSSTAIPLLAEGKPTGFPSPCTDYAQGTLDLNEYLVRHQSASFYFTVETNDMEGSSILKGDKVLVDRSLDAESGHFVVAVIENEYSLRTLLIRRGVYELHTDNPKQLPIKFEDQESQQLSVWGVVTGIVRKLKV